MKNIRLLIVAGLMLYLPVWSIAQRGSGGWCTDNNYSRLFNTATITEISGTVVSIDKIIPAGDMSAGLRLMVRTNNEIISVHLGPVWFLDNQDMTFTPGDIVVITGSKIIYEHNPTIIAVQVSMRDQVLLLRDRKGFPNWNAWRQDRKSGRRRNAIG